MKIQKYLAELIGAFALTLGVYLSLTSGFALATPVVAGLILGTAVYTVGMISGAHLNPAVTIALATVREIKVKDAVLYVGFQLIGAVLAMYLGAWLTGGITTGLVAANSLHIAVAEALGAAVLVFGVSSVVHGKVDDDASGLTIGSSLLIGIMMASTASNGVINPAVALGIGSVSYTYLLAPIAGGIVAAWIYRFLAD